MKKSIYALLSLVLLASCGGNKNGSNESREGEGGIYFGGIFRMNEVEDFRNLYPLNITEVASDHIAKQVYEGLVKLSQSDLSVLPSIAESWEKNEDATVWTFHIRKGVKFQNDSCFENSKGRKVTANDFVYSLTQLCTSSLQNQQFGNTFKDRVLGANEYFQSTIDHQPLKEGVAGIKAIDDYTLQITLLYPFAGFLNILSTPGCWVFPKEAVDKYGEAMRAICVGTGPFQIKSLKEGEAIVLERNPDYWNTDEYGNKLPYLDALKFTFIKEKKAELLEFKRGNLDMVFRLPVEMIADILGEIDNAKQANAPFEMQVVPAMSLFYYGFQHQSDVFSKKDVRIAFNYAIDREKIVNYVLQGDGVPAIHGVVPPSLPSYDNKLIHGYSLDIDKAKAHLAAAGYKNGKGFPKLTLQTNNGGGDRNVQIAVVVQKMLKENLNIDVDINVMPFAEHLENLETGKAQFWRSGWMADYPDPETFLTLFYGKHVPENLSDKSYLNSVRYKSAKFDSLFTLAMKAVDDKARMHLYAQADQTVIDDAAIMPIFYDENYRLVQVDVRNFPANAMEYRDLSHVYFAPVKETP